MSIEIKVPVLPESVADATIAAWHKKIGEFVERDENLVDLETDKVVLEVPAPQAGILQAIKKEKGTTVTSEEVIAVLEPQAAQSNAAPASSKAEEKAPAASAMTAPASSAPTTTTSSTSADLSPSIRRMVSAQSIDISNIKGTGKDGRITKEDVIAHTQKTSTPASSSVAMPLQTPTVQGVRPEQRVAMSRLRARVAERLVQAQHDAAMLTTFNEVNLKALMDLRVKYKDKFEKVHGVRLGFMSFYTKAVIEALKRFPAVNASIDGTDIIYHGYYDIGIAVSTERGLVVPVLRDADQMSMAQIEKQITEFAIRARDNKLTMEEMMGGTFTITNGGVFGSMLSTPIINPPQVGILGMHKITERPIVEDGQIVIRPMMYLALTYDHRIIDGKESVQFLVAIKECLEDPARLLLEV